ncbi:MAG TPA: hypothetical protein VHL11_13020, partial [Phototrophicaceae bacterium]|nr:hypothetical protein [Phototrophicaceae bacterium]
ANLIQFGSSIGLTMLFSNRIGSAYRFGSTRGCAAIILSTIALVAVVCVCALVLPAMMAGNAARPQ